MGGHVHNHNATYIEALRPGPKERVCNAEQDSDGFLSDPFGGTANPLAQQLVLAWIVPSSTLVWPSASDNDGQRIRLPLYIS